MNWNANFNLQIIGVSGEEKNKKGEEKLFEEMEINLPQLKMKDLIFMWYQIRALRRNQPY